METGCAPKGWPKLDGGFTTLVCVGGTKSVDVSMLEVYSWLGRTPGSDNIGHAGGFPLAFKGTEDTGIEGWAPDAKYLGGFGSDIT